MRSLLAFALLVSSCTSRPEPYEASGGGIVGTISSVDLSPMAYDGDAVIQMETDTGELLRVLIAARMNLCAATGLDLVGQLEEGDRITVSGDREGDAIRPCTDSSHRLARLEMTRGRYEGAYAYGFETSGFKSCEAHEEDWWVRPTDALTTQYRELMDARGLTPGRGLGPFVRLVVEGDVSQRGSHGHLGGWDRELVVTRVIEMEYFASGEETWPTIDCSE